MGFGGGEMGVVVELRLGLVYYLFGLLFWFFFYLPGKVLEFGLIMEI